MVPKSHDCSPEGEINDHNNDDLRKEIID